MASCKLTTENAHQYVGKYLVGRLWHNWPLEVRRLNDGRYAVVDSTKTMMLVSNDKFNAIYFDKVFLTREAAEKALNSLENPNSRKEKTNG